MPQPAAPGSPASPPVDQTQWERSVDSHEVNTLIIHDVGLIVFPLKTQSGPFNNSFEFGDVRSPQVYVNTYGQK
jgi:hypothetical protein